MVYLCLGLGSLFATPLMHRLGGPRLCMVIGSACDALWIVASIVPALKALYENESDEDGYRKGTMPAWLLSDTMIYSVTTITSILGGLGEAVQWVAQGKYIADCAGESTRGFFFGFFWAFYMASQIVGSLLAAIVLQSYDLITFYLIMACIAVISGVIFFFLRNPVPTSSIIKNEQ